MAMVLSPLVDACIGKVADLAAEKVGMVLDVKNELLRLQRRLLRLRNFLEDAEKKGIQDTSIRNWLGELKDVVYDAEDILDLCKDQQPPTSTPPPSVCSSCVPIISCFTDAIISCFTGAKFRLEMLAEEIKKLNDRLLEFEQDTSVLSKLHTSIIKPTEAAVGRGEVDHWRQTIPLLTESEIIGQQMEDATQLIVEWIINEEDKRKCPVFGVVGMGGIGKTTLARKVYNHASISQHFPTRIWVCISQTYSETELLKQIIRGAGGTYGEACAMAELTPIVASALSKNFFLVLDDVWRADVWENLLQKTLECATASGRVLITSRYQDIAKKMLAKNVYNVQKMTNSDGWVLLRKKVSRDYDDKEEMLGLKDIGIQIVNKCDGLPLAIEVIGGVLRTKDTTRSEWEKILRNNAWFMDHGELRGALYLSYEDLPVHLRQCFLYCSLYPEDHSIHRGDLIRYWVAEGFIRSSDGGDAGILMEDIADDYYLELVKRSLLQAPEDEYCSMHDMLRSMAQFIIKDESVCLVGPDITALNANTNLRKLRRLSLNMTDETVMPDFDTMREHLRHLRTLIFFFGEYIGRGLDENNHHLFDVLGHLRVLNLEDIKIKSLPNSLGKLVHLRHLRLDRTGISRLPDSIQNLVNLQYLSLSGCKKLYTLPKGITQLCNLRYLDISDTPLTCMPKGLDRMKQLNHLTGYSAGDETVEGQWKEGCNMNELGSLSQMRRLSIKNLHRATTGTPAIINKPFLKEMYLDFLNLNDYPKWYGEADIQRMEKVMEELIPPPSIQFLQVYFYLGRVYPSWISTPSLSTSFLHLETIKLWGCEALTQLPPLGQLPQLKFLSIKEAFSVVNVGPEFAWGHHGSVVHMAFPRLEILDIESMYEWKEWSLSAAEGGGETSELLFPRLKELSLKYCSKLRSLPASLSHANNLEYMELYGLDEITEVNQLFAAEGGGETSELLFPCLNRLILGRCAKLRSLPAGLSHANNLEYMDLSELGELTQVNQLPWLTHLRLEVCPSLERISHLPLLRNLEISRCPKLKDVVHLDALCFLSLKIDREEQYLPAWLLELVAASRRQMSKAHSSSPELPVPELFQLTLKCGSALLRRCLEGGEYWPVIQQFPDVTINVFHPSKESLAYTRTARAYKAKLTD